MIFGKDSRFHDMLSTTGSPIVTCILHIKYYLYVYECGIRTDSYSVCYSLDGAAEIYMHMLTSILISSVTLLKSTLPVIVLTVLVRDMR